MDNNLLIVGGDDVTHERVGAVLEDAGYVVLGCPGPGVNHCIGLTQDSCALTTAADAVLIDVTCVQNLAALEAHYKFHGLPVVGITGGEDPSKLLRAIRHALG